jgi:membrane-bound ClpP family serine protease
MEEMVGESGEVTTAAEKAQADGTYRGMAFVHGELWRIAASRPLPKGAMVRVMKVEGLTLHVEEAQKEVGTAKEKK